MSRSHVFCSPSNSYLHNIYTITLSRSTCVRVCRDHMYFAVQAIAIYTIAIYTITLSQSTCVRVYRDHIYFAVQAQTTTSHILLLIDIPSCSLSSLFCALHSSSSVHFSSDSYSLSLSQPHSHPQLPLLLSSCPLPRSHIDPLHH
jgi:hypothetical protein